MPEAACQLPLPVSSLHTHPPSPYFFNLYKSAAKFLVSMGKANQWALAAQPQGNLESFSHFENTHHHLAEADSRAFPFLLLVIKSQLSRAPSHGCNTGLSASHFPGSKKGLIWGLLNENASLRPVLCAVDRDRTDILTSQERLNVPERVLES